MTDTAVVALFRDALGTVLLVSAPLLGIGLVVGLIISVFQATTQIQEQTLSFVPKIVAIFLAMVVFGPWMLHILVEFTGRIFGQLLIQAASW
jgi:flagellar biosynthetic protein FliQ